MVARVGGINGRTIAPIAQPAIGRTESFLVSLAQRMRATQAPFCAMATSKLSGLSCANEDRISLHAEAVSAALEKRSQFSRRTLCIAPAGRMNSVAYTVGEALVMAATGAPCTVVRATAPRKMAAAGGATEAERPAEAARVRAACP